MNILLILLLLFVLLILVLFLILLLQTPDVARLASENPEESAFMRFRDRQFNYSPGQKRMNWTELSRISPYLIQSVIVAEDRTFLTHKGFYWEEMWHALLTNVKQRRIVKGGSSITQQLAKNLYLSSSRSLWRKIREGLITYRLENTLTKARIIELYLNVIEWGENIYGAEEASRKYFNKSANELRLSEAICLAASIPRPRSLSPLDRGSNFLISRERRILTSLLRHGWISEAKYKQTLIELSKLWESGNDTYEFVPFEGPAAALLTSEFWISRIKDPDAIIMDEEEINIFNQRAGLLSGGIDIFSLPEFMSREEIKDKIMEVSGFDASAGEWAGINNASADPESFAGKLFGDTSSRYGKDNEPLNADFYIKLLADMNIEGLTEDKKVSYALTVRRTDLLLWPSDELVMNKQFDYEFNRLHQSSLGIAEPVAVVHFSVDGSWAFVRTGSVDGWIKTNDLAFSGREEVSGYPGESFLVVTSVNCRTGSGAEAPLGAGLRLLARKEGYYEFDLPVRGENGGLKYVRDTITAGHVNEGFLKNNQSNAIMTAFKFLGTPYGWGGINGATDCSSYLQRVFSVFGIVLPRNSSAQTVVGRKISRFHGPDSSVSTKRKHAGNWVPGKSLLRFPGHIMLYLGEYEGKYYAIHSVWGITNEEQKIFRINSVAVTDLELGGGSPIGSLLERITDVASVDLEKPGFMSLLKDFQYALSLHPWKMPLVFITAFVFIIVLVILIKLL
jgi:monofunctional glycosyltransferase